ncbi:MAG: cupin domain-containing protein [Henriciella sp.]
MAGRKDNAIEIEQHDVFNVQQLTRDTPIEEKVGADLVTMDPGMSSKPHRHNFSETVLFFTAGRATVHVNFEPIDVVAGDRLLIHKGEFHSVDTPAETGCAFLSVQTPPILSKATGFRDFETHEAAIATGSIEKA